MAGLSQTVDVSKMTNLNLFMVEFEAKYQSVMCVVGLMQHSACDKALVVSCDILHMSDIGNALSDKKRQTSFDLLKTCN